MTILVRESAQNSWDARVDDNVAVDFRMDLQTVGPAEAAAWRQHFLRAAPAESYLPLAKSLRQPIVRVLSISDRGTDGLGGPTRADDIVDNKDRDFVSFLRNIGEPRDKALGGGTYGFGKGILYLVSKPGVILVYTRCKYMGRLETRLMGAALWRSYQAPPSARHHRYTGRHWWGDDSGDVIEPLVGEAAEDMARQFGLKPFKQSETGTTIIIVDPEFDDREPATVAAYLADTIAWQLWPKMLPRNTSGVPPMRFTVTCDGLEYPIPDPTGRHPLRLFVAAYQQMIGVGGRELRCLRPKRLLGRLGLEKRTMPPIEQTDAAAIAGIDGHIHHVCLMRPAELVVTYWPAPKPQSELISYAGVFCADPGMDLVYAAAEPPTHDTWNYQSLEDRDHRVFVRTTFTRLKEETEAIVGMRAGERTPVANFSLGAASDRFSPLIGGVWGVGGATDYGRPGETRSPIGPRNRRVEDEANTNDEGREGDAAGGASPDQWRPRGSKTSGDASGRSNDTRPVRRPRVDYVGSPYLDERDGLAIVVQEFRLPVSVVHRVTADLAVALTTDGGRETEAPQGASRPDLIGWEDDDGRVRRAESLTADGGDGRVWKAIVNPAPDTMTDIKIRVTAVNN
ncbi:hypothetical protein [Nocardia mexicana]|uniref:Uncharacterized protein n=1 Tax=Nocardia mexicana TaxID=279262 RepID=A0A370GZR2_9NOCA|nr:hypothetical protein [Nocardia mexicana]RDI49170.1 hypothetical protein DFR68_107298 [Nocardia mexicana]